MAKKKKTRAKRRVMGVLGKAGVFIMAVPPIAGSLIGAAQLATRKTHAGFTTELTLASKLELGYCNFMNNLAHGFSFPQPYKTIVLSDVDGVNRGVDSGSINTPAGVHWITTGLGGIMLAVDRGIAMVLKRPVKIPGTNITLTGN